MTAFFDDLDRAAEELNVSLDQIVRGIQIELFSGVIRDTRVDTGRLRGNWQTTVGQPASGELIRDDVTGQQAIREVESNVTSGAVVYLTNNLPYAEVWEQRDGMIARNMARLNRTIREVVRRNRAR
jgi:hypothetical protein